MRFRDYRLGDKPLKLLVDMTLFKNERCIVSVFKGTLALPMKFKEEPVGCIFHGKGKLLIDSIIETSRGAVGKPIERDWKEPFLMLGNPKEISNNIDFADASDLAKLGYDSVQSFIERVDEASQRFLGRKFRNRSWTLNMENSCLFAFMHEKDGYDTLISKRDKLLYSSHEGTYIFKGDKGILKRHGEVIVSKTGKTACIIDNDAL